MSKKFYLHEGTKLAKELMKTLSRNQEKNIRLLKQKKFRKENQLFVIEGKKMLKEALESKFKVETIIATQEIADEIIEEQEVFVTSMNQIKQLSSLKTPPGVLAVIQLPSNLESFNNETILVLDRIQNPGNLGTIIRTADALGIKEIVCSSDTVDCYSPKVIQATMGAIFRVQIKYLDLVEYLVDAKKTKYIYAADLSGENIYKLNLEKPSIIIMGNESEGINDKLLSIVNQKIKIPIEGGAESFNVSIATAIIMSEFKRQFQVF